MSLKGVDAVARKPTSCDIVTDDVTCRLTGEKTWKREVGQTLKASTSIVRSSRKTSAS